MRFILVFFFCILSVASFSQKQKGKGKLFLPPIPKNYSREEYSKMLSCAHKERIPTGQLLKQFPFNKASQIKLVSFENSTYDSLSKRRGYSESLIKQFKYNERKWRYDSVVIDTVEWKEQKILDNKQRMELADILFNYGFYKRPDVLSESKSGCYSPRNAILFYDSRGKIYSTIEVCFNCEEITTAPDKMNIGEMCTEKIELIRKFFVKNEIRYGSSEKNQSN